MAIISRIFLLVVVITVAGFGCNGVCRVESASAPAGARVTCHEDWNWFECKDNDLTGVTTEWVSRDDGDSTGVATCARLRAADRAPTP